ncbi:unnamed protein product [Cuscuta campestris]|uniref:Uncharacterized protein n=1 Tax=Cuscuta campestris TaxID=132261 RepID=A0A484N2P0_9ASTE|nr:unnamed protein product [Cuscuta campestris]
MEIAVIDWKSLDSRFVKDDTLEQFNAPQWVDFSAPDDSIDDEAWFCRPDCNHPKTVDDFYRAGVTPPSKKLQRSATVSENHLIRERIRRGKAFQGTGLMKDGIFEEDSENQNPNLKTPPRNKAKLMKEAFKSSSEKKKMGVMEKEPTTQKLRSTQSARNLFSGGDFLNRVTEFCNELKKFAVRGSERERAGDKNVEKTPLMEEKKKDENTLMGKKNIPKEKPRKNQIRSENAENTPMRIDVMKNSSKRTGEEILSQIRTNPPTPQCFSESRRGGPTKATPSSGALSSRTPPHPYRDRGVLRELGKKGVGNREDKGDKSGNRANHGGGGGGGSAVNDSLPGLDVFWFLKPCALSST